MSNLKENSVVIASAIICIIGFILFPKISDKTIKSVLSESEIH